jgi:hypothetical protein
MARTIYLAVSIMQGTLCFHAGKDIRGYADSPVPALVTPGRIAQDEGAGFVLEQTNDAVNANAPSGSNLRGREKRLARVCCCRLRWLAAPSRARLRFCFPSAH